jgi:hypothetical protein
LQSFPEKYLSGLKVAIQLPWNLEFVLWNTGNQIVSGGGQSKAERMMSESRVLAENILTQVLKNHPSNTPFWLTCLDPSQKLNFALTTLLVEKKLDGFIFGDFKNPWIPMEVRNDLRHIKLCVPEYQNLPNNLVFLRQSHFIVCPKKMEKTEPEIQNIMDRMLDQFGSLKSDLTLLWEAKDSLKTQLYHNPFSFPKNISNPTNLEFRSVFGLWIDPRVQEYPWQEQRRVLETLFRKHKIPYESIPTDTMKEALLSSRYFTIVLPYGPYFPEGITHEWILYYQRGGSFWFTGGIPFSKNVGKEGVDDKNKEKGNWENFNWIRRHLGFAPYTEKSKNWVTNTQWPLNKRFQRVKTSVTGLEVRHGSRKNYFFGTEGNVFPFREECARFEPLLELQTHADGLTRCVPIAFYDFFTNPYGLNSCSKVLAWGLDSLFHLSKSPKDLECWVIKIAERFKSEEKEEGSGKTSPLIPLLKGIKGDVFPDPFKKL